MVLGGDGEIPDHYATLADQGSAGTSRVREAYPLSDTPLRAHRTPSTASTRPASARTTYRTHPDTAITAEPALAYCQGRALPSRYETLPEMASAVQGNETIPYRRLGAAEIWSCPRCEQAQSVRFWAVPDSVPARGLPGLQRARLPSCVMPCSRRSSGDTPGGLGVLRLFCPSACCGRDGAEAAGWPGGEAARAGA